METAEEYIILNSFIPLQEIEKQKYKIEHYYNKHIASITNKKDNLRLITIKFKNNTSINLKAKHHLSKYIKKADIKGYELPFMLGINKDGNIIIADLKKTKHILISGEVGSGKSTIENSIIQSLMYFNNNIAFCLIDFKRVGLSIYKNFNNCYFCKEHKKFLELLEKLNVEMDSRYEKIENQELENLTQLNKINNTSIPFIVMVIDEIADIKLSIEVNNDRIEELLRRLMNMGRAAGIYTIAATQRPSGVQLSTEIRAALIAKLSFAIQEQTTQKMTGVSDTQDLGVGEFKTCNMGIGTQILKGFYIDRMKSNKTYVDLKEVLGNAVNKQIIEEE
jgi:DNA segregation ATPase FtsK/SpoIIIE-like protein